MLFESQYYWRMTKDGDPIALSIFRRHYSYKNIRRKNGQFVGPGEKMVLITHENNALFVWRKFISDNGQYGINCAVFRNESKIKSSELILQAELIANNRWPNERMYTYVNALNIKSKNPGYCFKMAGWKQVGITKVNKLVILEKIII